MDVDGSIVDFVTNVFFELGVLHALTQERRQSTLVKTEAILLSADFMCKTQKVELIFHHHLPQGQKKCPPKGAVVAERSDLYYLQELARSTSRGTCKEMSKCKVLRVCIPYGKASFGLGEGTI